MESVFGNDGSFESIRTETDYKQARQAFMRDSLNLGMMALKDMLGRGGKIQLSPDIFSDTVRISCYDQMADLAFNLVCKPDQIIWPGSEPLWDTQAENVNLKQKLRQQRDEIISLKVQLGEDDTVI